MVYWTFGITFKSISGLKNILIGKTKTTKLIINVLGKCQREKIVEILKIRKFSLLIDEYTDRSTIKIYVNALITLMTIRVKLFPFFLFNSGFHNNTEGTNEGMAAETNYNKMMNALTSEKVCSDNLVVFGSDGGNRMFDSKNLVVIID